MANILTQKVEKTAILSEDAMHRYILTRKWSNAPRITFIMLNPSTADAECDDPTIRRCIAFAKRLGGGELCVVNIYSLRATNPKELWSAESPVSKDNVQHLTSALHGSKYVIAAWGLHARTNDVARVVNVLGEKRMYVLGLTKNGTPRHPLYLKSDAPLLPWRFNDNLGLKT